MINFDVWNMVFILCGQYVMLQLFQFEYVFGLCVVFEGSGLDQFWYIQVLLLQWVEVYVQVVLQVQVEGKVLLFVICDVVGDIIGSMCFYDMDVSVFRFSFGYIWYMLCVQCIGVNIEVKLLLLQYVFEVMGCISVVLEISWFNVILCIVIVCLGVKQDGVLCNYKWYVDGMSWDIVIFFIIDVEWQGVKCYLQYCLDSYV